MNQQLKRQWQEEFESAVIETIREMLAQEPELVNVRVRQSNQEEPRWGPLFVASIKLNSLEIIKALVEAGANINNSELGTHWPSTDYEINRYLVEHGIDVNQPSYLGFHAIGVTGLDSFLLMMKHDLDPNFTWDYIGQTMLHMQALHDNDKELASTFMLIRAGANVNAQARTGLDDEPIMENEHGIRYGRETPLHSATRSGSKLQVRLLLDHGADASLRTVSRIVEPKQLTEWTEEVTSFLWPMTEFKRVLFEPYPGETPREMASRYGHHEIVAIFDERAG
ncbi:MAG: hypothetical protein OXN17_04260 [Candidatus Poribacteria bacterium]|nr:hypothetical protein [Candidatus Poribacteria bacterium]MDE0505277.1 hypothetical protein [Candidatus Poribacteria bacterium]